MYVMRRLKNIASGRFVFDTVDDPGATGEKVEQPKVEQPKVEQQKVEQPKVEQQKVEQQKVEQQKVEQQKVEQPKVEQKKVEQDSNRKVATMPESKDKLATTVSAEVNTSSKYKDANGSSSMKVPRTEKRDSQDLSQAMQKIKIRNDQTEDAEIPVVKGHVSETGQIIVTTVCGRNGQPKKTLSYMADRVVGSGTFGVVFQAKCLETGESVAIKKVLQDKRYKNRELEIVRMLDHPNIVRTKHSFYSTTDKNELYLNLVLEYVSETVYRVLRRYTKMTQHMPIIYVQLYTYQICRALNYVHSVIGVCHRDIKPQNILVNPHTHQVKVCDFGSAKMLVPGEPNISYICSRYYRAPELIFGATEYTNAIDMWSVGCVMGELILGQPLFPGESGVDQLVEIVKTMGTPTREEIKCMNPNYNDFKFPQIKAHSWSKVFPKRLPAEAVDLIGRLLQYSPNLRCTALEACAHPFFDTLREPNARLPNGKPFPPLFDFSAQELAGASPELRDRLLPKHTRN